MNGFGLNGTGSGYSPMTCYCENGKISFGIYERIYFYNSWVKVVIWRWFVSL